MRTSAPRRGLLALIAAVAMAAGLTALPARDASAGGITIYFGDGGHASGHSYRDRRHGGRNYGRGRRGHGYGHNRPNRRFGHYQRPHGHGGFARPRYSSPWTGYGHRNGHGQRHNDAPRHRTRDRYHEPEHRTTLRESPREAHDRRTNRNAGNRNGAGRNGGGRANDRTRTTRAVIPRHTRESRYNWGRLADNHDSKGHN